MRYVYLHYCVRLLFYGLIVTCIYHPASYGQEITKQRKVVPVITAQKFYLNGGFKASFGGLSRARFKVTLPENTVEWYYAVTATPNESSPTDIGLTGQLTSLLDPTGLTSVAVSSIMTPAGAGMCNVYLTDEKNSLAFLQKVDNDGGQFQRYSEATRENFTHGAVRVKSPNLLSGLLYLGIKNPSTSTGMNINLEVSAIIEEEILVDNWTTEQKNEFYEGYMKSINEEPSFVNKPETFRASMAGCMTKGTIQVPPSVYLKMATFEQQDLVNKVYEKCQKSVK